MNKNDENVYMTRNEVLPCPDCNSHDIQEKTYSEKLISNKEPMDLWVVVLLVLFFPLGICYLAYKLYKHFFVATVSEIQTRHFICRTCGREY